MSKENTQEVLLDTYNPDTFMVPVTLAVNTPDDPSKRNGAYTKTIKVPATKRNNYLLGHAFQIQAKGNFNRNIRTTGFINEGGIRIHKGSLKLNKIIEQDGRAKEYEINIRSNNTDWFDIVKEMKLRDVTTKTHVFDAATIEASWSEDGDSLEYVYPYIDYNDFFKSKTDSYDTQIGDLRPAFYVKPLLKRIFQEIDYVINSNFFERRELKSLILIPATKKLFITDELTELQEAVVNKSTTFTLTPAAITTIDFDNEVSDPSDNFNLATDEYTSPNTGKYHFRIHVTIINGVSIGGSASSTQYFYRIRNSTSGDVIGGKARNISTGINTTTAIEGDFTATLGDVIIFEHQLTGGVSDSVTISNIDAEIKAIELEPKSGDDIDHAKNLPDMTAGQLLKMVFQMFNIIPDTDVVRRQTVFETRDEYLFNPDETDDTDWTDKEDISKETEKIPLSNEYKRVHFFQYKDDDNDKYLQEFVNDFGEKLGDHRVELENQNLEGEQKVADLPVAATYMGYTLTNTLYAPLIAKEGSSDQFDDMVPRILIYNGLQTGDWTFNGTAKTEYPQAYFYKDDSSRNDINLSFRSLKDLGIFNEDKGLFERFYSNEYFVINNGHLLKGWFRIRVTDIINLSFRKPIRINKDYFYPIEIKDYLAGAGKTTECKLIER